MSLPVRYRPEAEAELEGFILAYATYSPAVAARLTALVSEQERTIAEFPESRRQFYRSLRAALVRRYHILIVYAILPSEIQVVALFDARSNPQQIRRALNQRLRK